jgi:hypothetical protein
MSCADVRLQAPIALPFLASTNFNFTTTFTPPTPPQPSPFELFNPTTSQPVVIDAQDGNTNDSRPQSPTLQRRTNTRPTRPSRVKPPATIHLRFPPTTARAPRPYLTSIGRSCSAWRHGLDNRRRRRRWRYGTPGYQGPWDCGDSD